MLVGVGLGCLLQIARGSSEVKVSGQHPWEPSLSSSRLCPETCSCLLGEGPCLNL